MWTRLNSKSGKVGGWRMKLVKKRFVDMDRLQRPKRLDKITNVLTLIRFFQTLSRKVAVSW